LRTAGQLALLAGVVAYDTAAKLLPEEAHSELLLKWPNDVLLKGGKVAGMLLEGASEVAPNRCKVVIGTGINLASYPTRLSSRRRALPRMAVRRRPPQPSRHLPPSPMPGSPLGRGGRVPNGDGAPGSTGQGQRAARCGCASPAKRPKEPIRPRFRGALRLLMSDGAERRIAAGDVFFASS
jgi:BirA family biotin operon repressor/biotin-[acetyl-CoA-carboxylase] ligase